MCVFISPNIYYTLQIFYSTPCCEYKNKQITKSTVAIDKFPIAQSSSAALTFESWEDLAMVARYGQKACEIMLMREIVRVGLACLVQFNDQLSHFLTKITTLVPCQLDIRSHLDIWDHTYAHSIFLILNFYNMYLIVLDIYINC